MRKYVDVTRPISYGPLAPNDAELRLCSDQNGKRALELGISDAMNALALAEQGAKAIAVDPDATRIARVREQADAAGLRVECHEGDLADLGWATSASIDLVVAAGTLAAVDDLARVLRQVHRVLKPEAPLVIATTHPAHSLVAPNSWEQPTRYGTAARSVADWYMGLYRANFRIDSLQELFAVNQDTQVAPSTLVIRARKLGV
jgi:SAM-dependent methyltransferase